MIPRFSMLNLGLGALDLANGALRFASPFSMTNGVEDVAYSQAIRVVGGAAPYTFDVIDTGDLPPGIADINSSTGVLAGTVTTAGSYTFEVSVTDANGVVISGMFTIDVWEPAPNITIATLPDAQKDVAYSQTVTVADGTAPLSFSIVSGALPAGLSINSGTGVISGTPTDEETATFTVRVTDAHGRTDDQALTIDVVASWLSQLLATGMTGAWLSDLSSYFTLTGSDVDVWSEANGDTDLDLSFNAGTKSIYDTTHPVNSTVKTVRNAGAQSRYIAHATNGKMSKLFPSGYGTLFFVVKIIDAVGDGAWSANDAIFRSGDLSSWGGVTQIAKRGAGGSGFRIRQTHWDGSTIRTLDHNVADEIPAGWHVFCYRAVNPTGIGLKVDDYAENFTAGISPLGYLDGIIRAISPYSSGQDVAIAAMLAYSWNDTTNRDTVIGQLQALISDLP